MKNQKTMGNKGFSLVELIVVIAIMVVLVAVLAPVFTKYVEQSRRATDVSNANTIAESVLTDVADPSLDASTSGWDGASITAVAGTPSTLKSTPTAKAKTLAGAAFEFKYTSSTNTVEVSIVGDGRDLTVESNANDYKAGIAASNTTTTNP